MGLIDVRLIASESGSRLGVLRAASGAVTASTPTTQTESQRDGECDPHPACRGEETNLLASMAGPPEAVNPWIFELRMPKAI
jgi:hypothetical protein